MQTVWTLLRKLNKKWVTKHTLDTNQATQGPIKRKTETLCGIRGPPYFEGAVAPFLEPWMAV